MSAWGWFWTVLGAVAGVVGVGLAAWLGLRKGGGQSQSAKAGADSDIAQTQVGGDVRGPLVNVPGGTVNVGDSGLGPVVAEQEKVIVDHERRITQEEGRGTEEQQALLKHQALEAARERKIAARRPYLENLRSAVGASVRAGLLLETAGLQVQKFKLMSVSDNVRTSSRENFFRTDAEYRRALEQLSQFRDMISDPKLDQLIDELFNKKQELSHPRLMALYETIDAIQGRDLDSAQQLAQVLASLESELRPFILRVNERIEELLTGND